MWNQQMDPQMQECIENCRQCHSTCEATLMSCLEKGGEHANPDHIRHLIDCAEACQASVNFMVRHSELHPWTCGTCAEACSRCAETCERMPHDQDMRNCAEWCRKCEASCRKMSADTSEMAGRYRPFDPSEVRTPSGEQL